MLTLAFWILECLSVTIGLNEDREVFYSVRKAHFPHSMAWMDLGEIQVWPRFLCSGGEKSQHICVIWKIQLLGDNQFYTSALNKLRERRSFRVYLTVLSLWHEFAFLDSVIITPGDQQTLRRETYTEMRLYFWNISEFLLGVLNYCRESLKGFLHWKSPLEGWL